MSPVGPSQEDRLDEGTRHGRFVVVRDIDGRMHALAATAVVAISEEDDGDVILLLAGSRTLRLAVPLSALLTWLESRG